MYKHLAKRFFSSLSPRPPEPAEEAWALGHLTESEATCWRKLSNPDRRHGIAVARLVDTGAGSLACVKDHTIERGEILAAALLHDSGKVVSDLGTFQRVGATLWWAAAPRGLIERWKAKSGMRGRLAAYRCHDVLGAEALESAGARPLVVSWARQHHLPAQDWSVEPELASLLKRCDDD